MFMLLYEKKIDFLDFIQIVSSVFCIYYPFSPYSSPIFNTLLLSYINGTTKSVLQQIND